MRPGRLWPQLYTEIFYYLWPTAPQAIKASHDFGGVTICCVLGHIRNIGIDDRSLDFCYLQ